MYNNYIKANLVIFSFIISFKNFATLNEKCITNLECSDSYCCRNDICVSDAVCISETNYVYIAVGSCGIVFLILTFIYFLYSIRETRDNLRKMQIELNNKDK